jgi:hypothetical protein
MRRRGERCGSSTVREPLRPLWIRRVDWDLPVRTPVLVTKLRRHCTDVERAVELCRVVLVIEGQVSGWLSP